jgi:pilus assembly protein CpaF
MADRIRALVALDSGVDSNYIQSLLPNDTAFEVVGLINGLDESWRTLQETAPDLLIVVCSGYSDRTLYFIDSAVKAAPDRPIVVLTTGSPNGFVRRVFESGADDILTLPDSSDQITFALEKAIARRKGAAVASGIALAPMICILGPKGGTGKTLVSSNLTVALAAAGHKATLVDLDLQFGDVGLSLGLRPDKTIYDLARSSGSLDSEKLDAYLMKHGSGARVLLAPTRPDQASVVTVDFLRDLFTTLRTMSDYVIIDTPPGFTPEVIAAIDTSSHVCMVGMLDALSLKNTKLGLETLELMAYNTDRIALVLNRADTRVGITGEDVEAIMGRVPDILIPSDRMIPVSVNEGEPIVLAEDRSGAARAFRALADIYVEAKDEVRERLVAEISDDILGHGPLERLLADDSVTEIMVNGPFDIWVERQGRLYQTTVRFNDDSHLRRIINKMVAQVGRRIDESSPMVDARLPDGSRVNAVIPPLSLSGPIVTIRKFANKRLDLQEMIRLQTLSETTVDFLQRCIAAQLNVLISGGTGSGKTTLLNALSAAIPDSERIVTIEDAAELQLKQAHVLRLEGRPKNIEGQGEVTIRDLVRNALRMRPDRIIVGEVRGAEALDMLQAMNTGHDGSITTVHANAPRDALARVETMVLMAGYDLPLRAIRQQIASALDLIVHLERLEDGSRRVTAVTEVQRMESEVITLQEIFTFKLEKILGDRTVIGHMEPTGLRPTFLYKFDKRGISLPNDLFGAPPRLETEFVGQGAAFQ